MLPGPTKGECACGCGQFGALKADGHIRRTCPCRSCLGRRSRRSGVTKQRKARKALNIAGPTLGADHEENWRGAVRVEVKSGYRDTMPAWTRYTACEAQSAAAKAIGDNRPFMAVLMPPGTSEGLVQIRLSQLYDVARALVFVHPDGRLDDNPSLDGTGPVPGPGS